MEHIFRSILRACLYEPSYNPETHLSDLRALCKEFNLCLYEKRANPVKS